jgi:hypothetical protein
MDRGNLLSRDVVLWRGAEYGRRWMPAMAGGVLAGLALLLAVRRCGGALTEPLGALPLASVGLLAALSAALTRAAAWPAHCWAPVAGRAWLRIAGPMALLVLLGWAVSLPGSSGLGLGLLWGILAAEEAWTLRGWLLHAPARSRGADAVRAEMAAANLAPADATPAEATQAEAPPADAPPVDAAPGDALGGDAARGDRALVNPALSDRAADAVADGTAADTCGDAAETDVPSPWDPSVEQLLVRRRDPEWGDVLHGWVRARLAPRQQRASVHIAFCPPFAGLPEVECEAVGDPAVRVSVGQCFPYGARLDVHCPAPSATEETAVLVEVFVRSDWHAPPPNP